MNWSPHHWIVPKKEDNGRQEEKKRKINHAKEAQLARQKMCQKAIDTMNNVNDLLTKVNTYLGPDYMANFSKG